MHNQAADHRHDLQRSPQTHLLRSLAADRQLRQVQDRQFTHNVSHRIAKFATIRELFDTTE